MKDKNTFIQSVLLQDDKSCLYTWMYSLHVQCKHEGLVSKEYIFVYSLDVLKGFKSPNGKEYYDKTSSAWEIFERKNKFKYQVEKERLAADYENSFWHWKTPAFV